MTALPSNNSLKIVPGKGENIIVESPRLQPHRGDSEILGLLEGLEGDGRGGDDGE